MEAKIKYPQTKCSYCGKPFTKKHNRQTYCSDACRNNARQEKKRTYNKTYYIKNRERLQQTTIGTRTIGPHKHPINEREQQIVQNEKQRLLKQSSNCSYYNMKVW